ncbi:hypothetical protein SAMD00019534_122430 [Acytostelium subglobosum LB1]|uniref:hypothetical protein n=1 Tax=Acytostelium subglobosum LB1 TaxID=1410327 RepID=UPI00064486F3|nr:hypothetical protein SAMD00019534_122430 [Acytostelium subglobosum LB1]GAM29067.1 hypothetical protein SAMD00019534_122430 [Acytostelium subglobosum LB1]|eukprot:XP_012747912.1 hypothetical protein SAMD00019534_122430 [Acytostelium subglobosum LB1]
MYDQHNNTSATTTAAPASAPSSIPIMTAATTSAGAAAAAPTNTYRHNYNLKYNEIINSIAVNKEGNYVCLGGKKFLQIVDLDTLKNYKCFQQQSKWEVGGVDWNNLSPNLIASSSNQYASIWDINSPKFPLQVQFVSHNRAIADLSWSLFEQNILATTSADSYVNLWDLRSPKRVMRLKSLSSHILGAIQVKWNKFNSHILASAHESNLMIWDIRKENIELNTTVHSSKVYGIDWSPHDPTEILTCSQDKTVKIWSYPSLQPRAIITTAHPVLRAKYLPIGRGIVTISDRGENSIRLWNVNDLSSPVATFSGHSDCVRAVDFRVKTTPNDQDIQIVSWSKDQNLRLWKLENSHKATCGIAFTSSTPLLGSTPNVNLSPGGGDISVLSHSMMSNSSTSSLHSVLSNDNKEALDSIIYKSQQQNEEQQQQQQQQQLQHHHHHHPAEEYIGPKELEYELKIIQNKFIDKSLKIEQVNLAQRMCIFSCTVLNMYNENGSLRNSKGNLMTDLSSSHDEDDTFLQDSLSITTVQLRATFPSMYPQSAPPRFECIPAACTTSLKTNTNILATLHEVAASRLGKPCLEQCLVTLVSLVKKEVMDRAKGIIPASPNPVAAADHPFIMGEGNNNNNLLDGFNNAAAGSFGVNNNSSVKSIGSSGSNSGLSMTTSKGSSSSTSILNDLVNHDHSHNHVHHHNQGRQVPKLDIYSVNSSNSKDSTQPTATTTSTTTTTTSTTSTSTSGAAPTSSSLSALINNNNNNILHSSPRMISTTSSNNNNVISNSNNKLLQADNNNNNNRSIMSKSYEKQQLIAGLGTSQTKSSDIDSPPILRTPTNDRSPLSNSYKESMLWAAAPSASVSSDLSLSSHRNPLLSSPSNRNPIETLPCPRLSGAVFGGGDRLVIFKNTVGRPALLNTHAPRTYKDLLATSVQPKTGEQQGKLTHSLSSTILTSPAKYDSPILSYMSPSFSSSPTTFTLSPLMASNQSNHSGHSSALITTTGGTSSSPMSHLVKIIDTPLSQTSIYLAKNYTLSGSISHICKHNENVAKSVHRKDLVKLWSTINMLTDTKLFITANSGKKQQSALHADDLWIHNPLGRPFVQTLFTHYRKIGDTQTLSMLVCMLVMAAQRLTKQSKTQSMPITSPPLESRMPPQSPLHMSHSFNSTGLTNFLDDSMVSRSYHRLDQHIGQAVGATPVLSYDPSLCLLSPNNLRHYDNLIMMHAEQLYRWELLEKRAETMKFLHFHHQQDIATGVSGGGPARSIQFHISCIRCQRPLADNFCTYCKIFIFKCAICRLSVRGLSSFCVQCGHGGHSDHMKKWFESYGSCPTGCGCVCSAHHTSNASSATASPTVNINSSKISLLPEPARPPTTSSSAATPHNFHFSP